MKTFEEALEHLNKNQEKLVADSIAIIRDQVGECPAWGDLIIALSMKVVRDCEDYEGAMFHARLCASLSHVIGVGICIGIEMEKSE
jgi:hypothetical protein